MGIAEADDTTESTTHDVIITGGLVFDGDGDPPVRRDIGVTDGKISAIVDPDSESLAGTRHIDARGNWVMPGFIDIHSHYDAELVSDPGLTESVRHGVTSVVIGNCSLSMITVDPTTAADLFARVEAIPHEGIEAILERNRTWTGPDDYRTWIDNQPLGPNVAAMLGHSDIRAAVLGLARATTAVAPTPAELAKMERLLEAALDVGFLGLSTMTTTLDKVSGEIAWSEPLPSTFASWSEYRALHRILRRRGRILQSAPNAQTQVNMFAFMAETMGLFRKPLRISLLTAMDLKINRFAHLLTRLSAQVANTILRGNLRWQTLPGPFTVRADGVEFNNFEEFASGRVLRDLRTAEDQYALLSDPKFQQMFVKDMSRFVVAGLWHRRVDDATIIDCPDAGLIGQTFGDIGRRTGRHPAREFLALAAEHKGKLRWQTTLGNDRPRIVESLLASPNTQIGFADSGAHLRNLALYNFGLRALYLAREAERTTVTPKITVSAMVRRLTAELADWWGLDAGRIAMGRRADITMVDPARLTSRVFDIDEAPAPADYAINRVVNRDDDGAVQAVIINGRVAFTAADGFTDDIGTAKHYGQFLPSTHSTTTFA